MRYRGRSAEFAELERAVDETRLQISSLRFYPLEPAAETHARVERNHVLGRIVFRISGAED